MKTLRNEITYSVACCCEKCRTKSGKDFEILGRLHSSIGEARKALEAYRISQHYPVFIVRETLKPMHGFPQKQAKTQKAA